MHLSQAHDSAVDRRRRIVVQYDAHGQLGVDFGEWLDFRFSHVDQPGSQVDAIWWDIGFGSWSVYPSEVLPPFGHPGLRVWTGQGIDWVGELVAQTRKRGLECFWNHRVSEVDISPTEDLEPGTRLMMDAWNPIKEAHPDWVIKTWWWQGMWNYAVPEVRRYHMAILQEVARRYDLDGFQLDFARHVPVLPVGRQWELREHVTEFVRMVRAMLQQEAERRGRPYLLAARVARNVEGCHADGFDVGKWGRAGLVDILTVGSRSMDVDIAGFRDAAGGKVRLQPCFDDHHATDGYRFQPLEFLRGVFANWWQQGADSVATFNWPNASADVCEEVIGRRWGRRTFNEPGGNAHGQAYCEVGEPGALVGKDKVFAVERRGGYPWAEGTFNRNDDAPLPTPLRHDGTPTTATVRVADPVGEEAEAAVGVVLRAVLFGARKGDRVEAALNGTALPLAEEDHAWKDAQIFSPAPQPASGGTGQYAVDPSQKLLRLDFAVSPELCRLGANRAEVSVRDRAPYVCDEIALEKLEVHVTYR